jgi:alpha-L-fucosidase
VRDDPLRHALKRATEKRTASRCGAHRLAIVKVGFSLETTMSNSSSLSAFIAKDGRSTAIASEAGAQRLSLDRLQAFEAHRLGLFIHFGISTFDGVELSKGDLSPSAFAPDHLDPDQWVQLARDAGAKYAVLTCKHVAGFALWPTRHSDYHIGASPLAGRDIVGEFVSACHRHGIKSGLYFCLWDNHNEFDSLMPTRADRLQREAPDASISCIHPWLTGSYAGPRYLEFVHRQLEELCTGYGELEEVWLDIPGVLGIADRVSLYRQLAQWQPNALIMSNNGHGDGSKYALDYAWPSDLVALERTLPCSGRGHQPWRSIHGQRYYLPTEVCDPMGREWFWTAQDRPRSDHELLGMCLVAQERGANLLLDVGPDPHGLITQEFSGALQRLGRNRRSLGL